MDPEVADQGGGAPIRTIFVLSCVRTGSSLLRYILDTHPAVYAPPELNLGVLATASYNFFSTLLGFKGEDAADMSDPEVLARVRTSISGVLDAETRRRGKSIWCEKTPLNLDAMDLLARLYPDAHFICLYRNRLDNAFSLLETSRYRPMVPLRKYLLRQPESLLNAAMQYWADGVSSTLDFERRHPEHTYRIRYEDVVTLPAETLAGLFRFLGIGWDPDLLDRVYANPHDLGAGDKFVRFAGKIRSDRVGAGSRIPASLIDGKLLQQLEELDRLLGYSDLIAELTRMPEAPAAPVKPDGGSPHAGERPAGAAGGRIGRGPRWVFESHLPARIQERGGLLAALGGAYRFVIAGDEGGAWILRRAGAAFVVCPDDPGIEAATTVGMKAPDLLELVGGELNVARAVHLGRIAISGRSPSFGEIEALVALIRTDV